MRQNWRGFPETGPKREPNPKRYPVTLVFAISDSLSLKFRILLVKYRSGGSSVDSFETAIHNHPDLSDVERLNYLRS